MKPYYDVGGITLYCGDCREILPTLGAESIDFVFTDPPYGNNNNNNGDLAHRIESALGLVKSGKKAAGAAKTAAATPGTVDEAAKLAKAGGGAKQPAQAAA